MSALTIDHIFIARQSREKERKTMMNKSVRMTTDVIRISYRDGKARVQTQSVQLPGHLTAPVKFAEHVTLGVIRNTSAKASARIESAKAGKSREELRTYPDADKIAKYDEIINEAEAIRAECARQLVELGITASGEIDKLAELVACYVTGDAYTVSTGKLRDAIIASADALVWLVQSHDGKKQTAELQNLAGTAFTGTLTPVRQAIREALAEACKASDLHEAFKLSISASDILSFIMQDGSSRLTRAEILHTMQDPRNKSLEKALPVYLLQKMHVTKGTVG